METEKAGDAGGGTDLKPVGIPVGVKNFEVSIICALNGRINSAEFSGVTFFGTLAAFCTGYNGRKRNGRDPTHFAVSMADRYNRVCNGHNKKSPFKSIYLTKKEI
jgi:hypothetical protein